MKSKERDFGRCWEVPPYFICHLFESKHSKFGYALPAYELTRHLFDAYPLDFSENEWREKVFQLEDLVNKLPYLEDDERFSCRGEAEDIKAVWDWYKKYYPSSMSMIPTRRRDKFVAGVNQALCDNVI